MDIVSRVKALVLKPKDEWVKIKAESTTVAQLFTSYAMILAAIPAAAQFIGFGLIGRRYPFVGVIRLGIGTSLLRAIFSYVFSLVTVYVFALIINALAPTFGSTANMLNAMKLAVFSMTPGWVAGVLYIIPYLDIIVILASLYGLFILYLGFATPMMETPKDKVMGYFVVSIIVVVVLSVVVAFVVGAIFAVGGVYRPL
ncbi:MAG: YIP1 family protein [Candidatus Aminicenantes bacterium]|nr:YIP1 family protein [Candidatus Aminicenantes bacterium]